MAFLRLGRKWKKMSNVTTYSVLQHCLYGALGVQGTHSLVDWIALAFREAWSNESSLPEDAEHWKYTEEV